jgi:hypothetical protein
MSINHRLFINEKRMIMKKIKLIFALSVCFGIIHATDTTFVQKKIALHSISMNTIVSGNGFGLQYVPMAGIRFGECITIAVGPMFNTNWNKTGAMIRTGYLLVRENKSYGGHMSLSANFSLSRINSASLSASSVAYEKRVAAANQKSEFSSFENLRYSGWEYAAGFSMNYRFRCGLLFKTSISYALTETSQINIPTVSTSRENHIGSLQLGAGIGWKFGKMMSKSEHDTEMMAEEEAEDSLLTQK